MNNLSTQRRMWDDDEDDTPPLQRWIRGMFQRASETTRRVRQQAHVFANNPGRSAKQYMAQIARNLCTVTGVLVVIWVVILYRGESSVFDSSISTCDWANWERWPANANPHRLVFVSDPQLVDPHTYPDRPWPLSTLTVKHTDLYMRRAYSRIQSQLFPDTIIFLGDLFDGGREWSTTASQSPEERYRQYGDEFWQKEYGRFSGIFLHDWRGVFKDEKPESSRHNRHPRIIASLPGNHDLGFGQNIQLPVRERFNAFFGESNRIDLIGNHTFVSLDTVSLSAMDSDQSDTRIWQPAHDFLQNAKTSINQMIEKQLQHMQENIPVSAKHNHEVADINDNIEESDSKQSKGRDTAEIPTILLTHVPLDRPVGKPCGPLRERWPPTPPPAGQTEPVEPDERNSIPAQGYGWQYQDVLSTRVSHLIAESLDGTITRAFSGDDHDYCDVIHRAYPSPGGGIREITVKSISWAMGVRKPGVVLASLWNEIDSNGKRVHQDISGQPETIQTHLCLLPDQISILIRYGILLGLSLVLVALQAIHTMFDAHNATPGLRDEDVKPILPSNASSAEHEKLSGYAYASQHFEDHSQASSSSSSDDIPLANLLARSAGATRPRSVSPLPLYGNHVRPVIDRPLVSFAANRRGWKNAEASDEVRWGSKGSRSKWERRRLVDRPIFIQFAILLGEGVWKIARVVLVWYFWLLYK